jgi:hypothetical protein
MTSPFRSGTLVGFIVGAALVAGTAMILKPRPVPAPPSPPADAAAAPAEARLRDEIRQLKNKVLELEAEREATAARSKKDDKPSPAPAAAPSSPPAKTADYKELFAKLSELGLGAFAGPKFKEAVEAVKSAGAPAVEFLCTTLKTSTSASERFMAAALLEGAADPSSIDALAFALKGDGDDIVRRMASHALAVMAAPAAEAPLRAATTDDADWGVRVNSAYGLAKLGKDDGLKMLTSSYESADTPPEYRLAILGGLADVAAPSTAPLFRKILSDTKDAGYLLVSIGALEKMKDAESLPALQRVVDSTQPPVVKQAASKAIDAIRRQPTR